MCKRLSNFLFVVIIAICCNLLFSCSQENQYSEEDAFIVEIDLLDMTDNMLHVKVTPPSIQKDTVIFNFPSIIPGIYHYSDFGQYINQFVAYGDDGKIPYNREGYNTYVIPSSSDLSYISYYVKDGWQNEGLDRLSYYSKVSHFDKGNAYVLNLHTIVGYLEKHMDVPYKMIIHKPSHLHGVTTLTKSSSNDSIDVFTASDYTALIDCPILYSKTDTVNFIVDSTEFKIAVFSTNPNIHADDLLPIIKPIAVSGLEYLGDFAPKKYTFFLCFYNNIFGGGLEHRESSLITFPNNRDVKKNSSNISRACAHEFLHLLTPINIRSERISRMDYLQPLPSKHLWFYEGVIEYLSMQLRLHSGLIESEDFFYEIGKKVWNSDQIFTEGTDTFSLIEQSLQLLSFNNMEAFKSVYNKGAIAAFMLDIRINELSKGKQNLLDIVQIMGNKYNKDVAFDDDELFAMFSEYCSPALDSFFRDYIQNNTPLPFEKYLDKIGYTMADDVSDSTEIMSYNFLPGNTSVFINNGKYYMAPDSNYFPHLPEKMLLDKINGDLICQETINKYLEYPLSDSAITISYYTNGFYINKDINPEEKGRTNHYRKITKQSTNSIEQKILFGKTMTVSLIMESRDQFVSKFSK